MKYNSFYMAKNNQLLAKISIFLALLIIIIFLFISPRFFTTSNEQKAVMIVQELPEIKEWLTLFSESDGTSPSTGGRPIIEFDHEDSGIYTIHVWEIMEDHGATFGWYEVNLEKKQAINTLIQ